MWKRYEGGGVTMIRQTKVKMIVAENIVELEAKINEWLSQQNEIIAK